MTRSWEMHAGQYDKGESEGDFWAIGDYHFTHFHGIKDEDIHKVIVTEDPEGKYWGWIACRKSLLDPDAPGVWEDSPTMIYNRKSIFSMCFPYGYKIEVEHGKGAVVRLRVEEA